MIEDGREVAWFTLGARTVTVLGAERCLSQRAVRFEGGVCPPVRHAIWAYTLPEPFLGRVSAAVFADLRARAARGDTDLLDLALAYTESAPEGEAPDGSWQGPAGYGPAARPGGVPDEGSDWNDCLGVDDDGRAPRPERLHTLDCSGLVRLVFRRDGHVPLRAEGTDFAHLPRRARQIATIAPGVLLHPQTPDAIRDHRGLRPGDLVFFHDRVRKVVNHVGLYLGLDEGGPDGGGTPRAPSHRFVSSRRHAGGPTMGDEDHTYAGEDRRDRSTARSVLDGDGFYANRFVAVRRL